MNGKKESVGGEQSNHKLLAHFIKDCQGLEVGAFTDRHGEAFFLHHGSIGKLKAPMEQESTVATDVKNTSPARHLSIQEDFLVFPVRRVNPATAEEDFVWMGRSDDNDIVVPDASVSFVHAFVRRGEQGEFLIQDMNSMNGTFVNDEPVPAQGMGQPVELQSGARIHLGKVALTFLKSSEFRQLVRQLTR